MQNDTRKVIVKNMTVSKDVNRVYDFFEDVKNMETGGILKSVTRTEDGWWTFDTPIGKAKMKLN